MNNFDLRNPTHILFGKGRIADLDAHFEGIKSEARSRHADRL